MSYPTPFEFTREEVKTIALLVWSTRGAPELVDRLEAWRDAIPEGGGCEVWVHDPDEPETEVLVDECPECHWGGGDHIPCCNSKWLTRGYQYAMPPRHAARPTSDEAWRTVVMEWEQALAEARAKE